MKYKIENLSTNIVILLDNQKLKNIVNFDDYGTPLYEIIGKIEGLTNIDYSGMLKKTGIYLTIENEVYNNEMLKNIEIIINKYEELSSSFFKELKKIENKNDKELDNELYNKYEQLRKKLIINNQKQILNNFNSFSPEFN